MIPPPVDDDAFAEMLRGMGLYFPRHGDVMELLLARQALIAMGEPSLADSAAANESYRFLWLRTFHQPIAVRLARKTHGATIITKILDGQGGFAFGALVQNAERQLADAEVAETYRLINAARFWSLPTRNDRGGLDGAEWILEGQRDGRHHVVVRWSPRRESDDGAFRALCEHLLLAAKVAHEAAVPVY